MGEKELSLVKLLSGVPPEKLDNPCQDKHLREIACHVTDWVHLAPFLGLKKTATEEVIGKWPFSVPTQRIEFLRKWREKYGPKATYRNLCESFWKAGYITLSERVIITRSCASEGTPDNEAVYFHSPECSEDEDAYITAPEDNEDELITFTPSLVSDTEPSPILLQHADPVTHVECRKGVGCEPPTPPPTEGQLAQEGMRRLSLTEPTTCKVNSPIRLVKKPVSVGAVTQPSVEEILSEIPPEKLDQPCLDEHLCKIAQHVTDWPSLAPLLGLTGPEMDEVRGKYPTSVGGQRMVLLRKWKDKLRKKATYRKLCEGFSAAERTHLVEKVCDILCTSKYPTSTEVAHPLHAHAQYLCEMYDMVHSEFLYHQWPPPPTKKFFKLAMIHTRTIQRGPVIEEPVRQLQTGNVAGFMKRRTPVQLQEIFKLDNEDRKIVLIEGAPGSGKSTLAWHACLQWKTGELFQEFRMVIFVQLRDPRVQSAQSVADLLPAGSEERRGDAARVIEACEGREVLFVMDGWDEYVPGLQTDSIVYRLICKPHELDVPYCTLLITSRSISSAGLQRLASSRVEIVGFTREEISQYFEEVLEDPTAVHALQKQLKDLPVIEASCCLPLNAAIVAQIFLEQNHTLPRTLYEVLSALVCHCIVRYLMKKSERSISTQISSLDKIPPTTKAQFVDVCMLAYEASMQNKVTFSGEDLSFYGVSVEGNGLELMQVVQSLTCGKSKSYHFLHLSVQELLAAKHVSKLKAVDQVNVFRERISEPRLVSVFRFYAALTKLKTEGIRDVLASMIIRSVSVDPLSPEGHQWRQHVLNILRCLYEAQDESLCLFVASLLGGALDLSYISLNALDCLCVGYFLCCVCSSREGEFSVGLKKCGLDSYSFGFVVKELGKCIGGNNVAAGCLGLDICYNNIDGSGVCLLCENTLSVIRKLNLSGNRIQDGEDGLLCLVHLLCSNRTLTEVKLESCNLRINAENGPALVDMLHKNFTLKELKLSTNEIGDIGVGYTAKGMIVNTGVERLEVRNCGIGEEGGKSLGQMLTENRHLEHLDISRNAVGDNGVDYIVKGMVVNHTLLSLELAKCGIGEEGSKFLERMLTENRTLENLDVSRNEISTNGVGYIVKGMNANSRVVSLGLVGCGMGEEEGRLLGQMLTKNRALEQLDIGHNAIGDSGLGYIVDGMVLNSGVRELVLRYIDIGEGAGKLLGRMLTENRTLEHLSIRVNEDLGDVGITAVSKSLKQNHRLKELDMWRCECSLDCLKEFVLSLRENSHLKKLWVSDEEEVESLVEERAAVNDVRRQRGEAELEIVA